MDMAPRKISKVYIENIIEIGGLSVQELGRNDLVVAEILERYKRFFLEGKGDPQQLLYQKFKELADHVRTQYGRNV